MYLEGLQLPDGLLSAALEEVGQCRVEAIDGIIAKLLGGRDTHVLHGLVVLLPAIVVDLTLEVKKRVNEQNRSPLLIYLK